jgi:hypothetical protein
MVTGHPTAMTIVLMIWTKWNQVFVGAVYLTWTVTETTQPTAMIPVPKIRTSLFPVIVGAVYLR